MATKSECMSIYGKRGTHMKPSLASHPSPMGSSCRDDFCRPRMATVSVEVGTESAPAAVPGQRAEGRGRGGGGRSRGCQARGGWGWGLPPQQAGDTLLPGDSGYCDRSEFTFCAPERFPVSWQAGDAPWVIRCLALLGPEETAGCGTEGLRETSGPAIRSVDHLPPQVWSTRRGA